MHTFFDIIYTKHEIKQIKKYWQKTGFNIELSQMLTMNAAKDIKILNMYLQFGIV